MRSSLLAFIVRGLGAISTLIMSIAVARSLPAEDAGLFFLALSIITFLANIGLLGLNQSVLRFIGYYHSEKKWSMINAVSFHASRWASICLLGFCLGLYIVAPWLSSGVFEKPTLTPVLRGLSPSVFFLGIIILLAHQLQAINRTTKSIILRFIAIPLVLGATILFVNFDTAHGIGTFYSIIAMVVCVLGCYLWWNSHIIRTREKFDRSVLWASCFPLWIVILMGQTSQWSAQFVAGAWVSASEIAQLSVAQRTATLVNFILIAVNLVIAPRLAGLYAQKKYDEVEKLALKAVRIMIFFAVPIFGLILAVPGWVMSLFGDTYSSGATLLVILASGQLINVLTGSTGYLLSMSGHEGDLRNVVLISGPIAVGSALLLTPLFGVHGAAVATAIAVASQNLLSVYMVKKRLGFNTMAIWRRRDKKK